MLVFPLANELGIRNHIKQLTQGSEKATRFIFLVGDSHKLVWFLLKESYHGKTFNTIFSSKLFFDVDNDTEESDALIPRAGGRATLKEYK